MGYETYNHEVIDELYEETRDGKLFSTPVYLNEGEDIVHSHDHVEKSHFISVLNALIHAFNFEGNYKVN